jgi:hypothetical protein
MKIDHISLDGVIQVYGENEKFSRRLVEFRSDRSSL